MADPVYSQVPSGQPGSPSSPFTPQTPTMPSTGSPPIGPSLSPNMPTQRLPVGSSPLNPHSAAAPPPRFARGESRDGETSSSEGSSQHQRSRPSTYHDAVYSNTSLPTAQSSYLSLHQTVNSSTGQFPPPMAAFASHGGQRESTVSMGSFDQALGGGDYSRYSMVGRPVGHAPVTPGTPASVDGRGTPIMSYFGSEVGSTENVFALHHSSSAAGLLANAQPSFGFGQNRHSIAASMYSEGGGRDSMYFAPQPLPKVDDSDLLWDPRNAEADDFLHEPVKGEKDKINYGSGRGWTNVMMILVLIAALLSVFLAWPVIIYHVANPWVVRNGLFNIGWTNSSGQVPDIPGFAQLIDAHTPDAAKTWTSFETGEKWDLVFSDEFETDDRTFWPGDDPFWEAVSLNYWQTVNLEWLDPDAVTTKNGKMVITLSQESISNYIGNFSYRSGMVQSWNKLCFKDAYIEVSVSLPGLPNRVGYWPGAWTMGNLARAGFGASNDGLWPYSYDTCDVGTLRNQTDANGNPAAARTMGDPDYGGTLSYLPGQRLSACTCPNSGADHPGPNPSVGRGGPEIDILEAQADYHGYGTASQSMQIAPFDDHWGWLNTTPHLEVYNPDITTMNLWKGSINQEAASAVTHLDTTSYNGNGYTNLGYEYKGGGDGYITWAVNQTKSWTLRGSAFPPNPTTQIGQRLISQEPMYAIMNLFLSNKFQGDLDLSTIQFPASMYIDYVRVYQKFDSSNIVGKKNIKLDCSPDDYPTADYIKDHIVAYTHPEYTTFKRAGYEWPKNSMSGC